jgi:hypothetical protein
MKCYVHDDRDAVGACMSCGKATCMECAVNFQGRNYCKTCMQTGMIGAPQQQYMRPSSTAGAQPKGEPNKQLFTIGAVGSVLSIFSVPVALTSVLLGYYYMGVIMIFASMVLVSVAIILQSIGMYGFYRNYGIQLGLFSAILGIITAVAVAALVLFLGFGFTPYFYYYSAPLDGIGALAMMQMEFFSFLIVVILGAGILVLVTGLLWGVTFIQAKEYMENESLAMVTGIFFLLGGLVTVIPSLLAAIVFFQAEVPDPYGQPSPETW